MCCVMASSGRMLTAPSVGVFLPWNMETRGWLAFQTGAFISGTVPRSLSLLLLRLDCKD
jgi:hypothetical protein